ncbi:HNH endonuclease [Chryseobacterium sp. ISL-6]|uniref:HNH endonuclease n=1 Tax=Chryseobacterium sp. ISL-6 TaxID=2819143 RepID=UPI001BEBE8C6|nr:HNH endonuclease [Chryseobacterium sp. ISL-6]MBT2623760.1 HNH endonuclease [Chryseobacterium sp. ISL-6]
MEKTIQETTKIQKSGQTEKKKHSNGKARKRLSDKDLHLLFGLSGGICAYCKKPFIDMATLQITVHQAHVIARDNKNLKSYRDIPYELKDRFENMFLLHPTCHKETENFELEELQFIKKNHEKHIRDTLNGVYNPYPVGNGKYLKYPHVVYEQMKRPFNKLNAYLNLLLFGGCIVIFILLFIFVLHDDQYLNIGLLLGIFTIFFIFAIVMTIKSLKEKPSKIVHEAECIFAGCNGKVLIRRQSIFDTFAKRNLPATGMGVCNFDITHTFTVPQDLKLSNRGDYHQFIL